MITGVVKSDEGRIRLTIRGLHGQRRDVEVVIDTGYTASLMLPPSIIGVLGLRWRSIHGFTLADGSESFF
jgi:predicted aspartyl protease